MNREKPLASENECIERREFLIDAGIIKPGEPTNHRQRLVDRGIINPIINKNGKFTFCELPPKSKRVPGNEEGEYVLRPIKSDKEYYYRKAIYFRMLQEILFSRQNLELILGKKENNAPRWYF